SLRIWYLVLERLPGLGHAVHDQTRAELLHRVADVCERRAGELARILTLDQGKPLRAEAEGEVGELIEFWRMAAEDGKRLAGTIPESAAPGRRVLLLRRPLG